MMADAGPLAGCRVAVTRPLPGALDLADAIRRLGGEPVVVPLVQTVPPADRTALQACVQRLSSYDWIVFTSARAAVAVAEALHAAGAGDSGAGESGVGDAGAGTDGTDRGGDAMVRGRRGAARVAAVGRATAASIVTELGWSVDVLPAAGSAAGLAAALSAQAPLDGCRVLWPRARDALPELPRALLSAGAYLDAPEAYVTEAIPGAVAEVARLVDEGAIDVLTFTSPSAVLAWAAGAGNRIDRDGTVRPAGRAAGPAGQRPARAAGGDVIVAVIGATTARAARAHGLAVDAESEHPGIHAMLEALERQWRRK